MNREDAQRWLEASPPSRAPGVRRDALRERSLVRRLPLDELIETLRVLERIESGRARWRRIASTLIWPGSLLIGAVAAFDPQWFTVLVALYLASGGILLRLEPLPDLYRSWLLPLLYRSRHRLEPLEPASLELDLSQGRGGSRARRWCRLILPTRQGPKLRITCQFCPDSSGVGLQSRVSVGLEDWDEGEDRVRCEPLLASSSRDDLSWSLPVEDVVEMVEEVLAGERERFEDEKKCAPGK